MAQVRIDTTLRITDTGDSVLPVTSTASYTYTAKVDKEYSIPAGTVQTVWINDAEGSDDITANDDFDFLYAKSDTNDVYIELVGDLSNNGAADANVCQLSAYVPFMLGNDNTSSGHSTADALGTITAQVFERIRVRNSSSDTATVRVIMAT